MQEAVRCPKPPELTPGNSTAEKLLREYAPLVRHIAQRLAAELPANIDLEDLVSTGYFGLLDAIEKYDRTRVNKFKTYAEFRIRGAMLDDLRSQDWLSRTQRDRLKRLERFRQEVERIQGRVVSDEEICRELKLSAAQLQELHLSNGEAEPNPVTPLSELDTALAKRVISSAIGSLPEQERLVLSLYYYEELTQREIGQVLGVEDSRVSQLHRRALLRIKSKLAKLRED